MLRQPEQATTTMQFWASGGALTAITIIVLLLACEVIARLIPPLRRLGLPLAILAGAIGLLLGDQALGLLSLDIELLESVVYHGLAIVFISVSLKAPSEGGRTAGSRSMAFAIVAMMATQAVVGLGVILALDSTLHPGFGLLLPMGFEEGPGQALSMGAAWDDGGLPNGAQVGLIIAVIGFGWCVLAGVPLVIWGRRKGWAARDQSAAGGREAETITVPQPEPGSLDTLTTQAAVVGLCYLLTWALCTGLARALASMPDLAAMVWGFHFIFGAAVAMAMRPLLARLPGGTPVDDRTMGRVGGFTVDVITCAALSAVQIAVLRSHWLPIVLVTTLGGLWTLVFAMWMARRAWTEAPFEHAVLWFGMSTGTLPTGLALLKVVDPDMRSPAAVSAVFGSAGSVIGVGPLLMGLVPMTVAAYGGDWPGRGWLMLGALVGYSIVVIGLWRAFGGLRFRGPLLSMWPDLEEPG
ncbi:Sodium/glutamate symporter [Enhygromyxa salina]|uniref:Sodium/glutamate symporter n=1 Tax=Enhygromyxa salina TaxID=215803 RepID=A0A2S9XJR2_9BACT|nr:sodium/glutamate symporter [Enhygromyxa salina]PRP93077.1 Sodium/glutamate symporter [Enhygromyxa salina]